MSFCLMAAAVESRTGSPISQLLLLHLASYANDDGLCWPAIDTLAADCELSKWAVKYHLKRLSDNGYLQIIHRQLDGASLTNHYRLLVSMTRGGSQNQWGGRETTQGGLGDNPDPIIDPINNNKDPSAISKLPAHTKEFQKFKLAYPPRLGAQPWLRAERAINSRLKEGHTWEEIVSGTKRYAVWCKATGKLNTEFVKQAVSFVGPDLAFMETWDTGSESRALEQATDAEELASEPGRFKIDSKTGQRYDYWAGIDGLHNSDDKDA